MQEMQESQVRSLGQEDRLEEDMAIHSSILAWKVPWTEEPGGLQDMGWQGVGRDRTHSQMTYFRTMKDPRSRVCAIGNGIFFSICYLG